jgi:hypothetical protein
LSHFARQVPVGQHAPVSRFAFPYYGGLVSGGRMQCSSSATEAQKPSGFRVLSLYRFR